jgi:[ribosomal protein S5]-alanine N-acetyltransferase
VEPYELLSLSPEFFPRMYRWNTEEKHNDRFSCRPPHEAAAAEKFYARWRKVISTPNRPYRILVCDGVPLGRISLFDYNPRNHSAEFGYYLPEQNRAQGMGTVMVGKFLAEMFQDESLALNKIIATTSSNNEPSIRLLQKFGFHLDGRQREHYWIDGEKYDQMIYSLLKSERESRE